MRLFLSVLFMFLPVTAFAAVPLMLSRYGKTEYVIVLPAEPTPVELSCVPKINCRPDVSGFGAVETRLPREENEE